MGFTIEKEIWEMFPGMRLVTVTGKGVDNKTDAPSVGQLLQNSQAALKERWQYPNPQSHPNIAAWRQAYQKMGVSGKNYPSAIESLTRRVLTGREVARINPLVDLYNAISLRHVVPVGGWDVDEMAGGEISLRLTKGGERFTELGQAESVQASPREVSYADAEELITRHFVWRQSERAKITHQTTNFFLISEILPEVGGQVAEDVRSSFGEYLREFFKLDVRTAILDSNISTWDF